MYTTIGAPDFKDTGAIDMIKDIVIIIIIIIMIFMCFAIDEVPL